jgi:class I fructose-bisphosphate aldolase
MIPDDENPKLSIHSWVDDALRLGCEGVGFTLYPGSAYSNEMEEQARELVADARKAGLIVVFWVYPRGEGIPEGKETTTDIIAYGATLGANLGGHIIKVKLPTTKGYGLLSNESLDIYKNQSLESLADRVKLVVKSAYDGHRIIIHSGGSTKSSDEVLSEIRELRDGGAFGSIMGRNVFQRETSEAIELLHQVEDILVENG